MIRLAAFVAVVALMGAAAIVALTLVAGTLAGLSQGIPEPSGWTPYLHD